MQYSVDVLSLLVLASSIILHEGESHSSESSGMEWPIIVGIVVSLGIVGAWYIATHRN